MKYYVCEGITTENEKYNAGSKAREDIEKILDKEKIKRLYIQTKIGIQEKKILKVIQLLQYMKNRQIWNKSLKSLKKGDAVIIQYPLRNITIGFSDIIKKYRKKGIRFIAIIHDLDSLRCGAQNMSSLQARRIIYEDRAILKEFNNIVSHNKSMTKELLELGNSRENIVELEIFDYLIEKNIEDVNRNKKMPVIIAGNLSSIKAKYLKELKDIKEVHFNLYGRGYDLKETTNVEYKGAFLPEELANNLEGGFGLIWDGDTKETCKGFYGNYLRYNNPHKTSLYLVSGLPVIAWEESAIAEFILKNNVGFCIDKLDDIPEMIKKLSDEEYQKMVMNAKKISIKLMNGEFTRKALKDLQI